ncbi:MAG: hypothetical protein JJ850_10180 [Kordiimonadaceae bacterium]|nr:hypothetical protein [Kordiimonadaceae bacterium]MBO6569501.1 hypothetical protein [Kordiimonadaceae bacterium]MBO6964976.1 hypothetical protein [Kordiimonadaceae bacterium]
MLYAKDLSDMDLVSQLKATAANSGWPYQALGMTSEDILVLDRAALEIVEVHRPEDGPALVLVDDFEPANVEADQRVFVLMRAGERSFVRTITAHHPDMKIASVVYGDTLHLVDIKKRVRRLRAAVLISSPSSGGDYLSKLLDTNKIAGVLPGLDELYVLWSRYATDFSANRRFLHLLETAKQSSNKKPVVLSLELDQLDLLTTAQLLTLKQFRDFSIKLNIATIYLLRRNKSLQAARIASLVDDGDERKGMPSPESLMPILLDLAYLETHFERFMINLTDAKVITFEELLANPVAVLSMLTLYLGEGTLRKAKVVDPRPFDVTDEWREDFVAHFKNFAQEYIGVRKNKVGSYADKSG